MVFLTLADPVMEFALIYVRNEIGRVIISMFSESEISMLFQI